MFEQIRNDACNNIPYAPRSFASCRPNDLANTNRLTLQSLGRRSSRLSHCRVNLLQNEYFLISSRGQVTNCYFFTVAFLAVAVSRFLVRHCANVAGRESLAPTARGTLGDWSCDPIRARGVVIVLCPY